MHEVKIHLIYFVNVVKIHPYIVFFYLVMYPLILHFFFFDNPFYFYVLHNFNLEENSATILQKKDNWKKYAASTSHQSLKPGSGHFALAHILTRTLFMLFPAAVS